MNYCIMHYFWSKELATILSKLLTITVAFYVVVFLPIRVDASLNNKQTKHFMFCSVLCMTVTC